MRLIEIEREDRDRVAVMSVVLVLNGYHLVSGPSRNAP